MDRWDVALLAVHFVDAYGDQLFVGNYLMLLTERLGASNMVAVLGLASLEFCVSLYLAVVAGRLQDQWPREGPLGSVSVCKVAGIAVLALVWFVSQWDTVPALVAVCVLVNVFYAATEAFSANAYLLAISRSTRLRPALEDQMWRAQYTVFNAAIVAGRGSTALARWWWAPHWSQSHAVLLGSAAFAFFLASTVAWRLHRHHTTKTEMRAVTTVGDDSVLPNFRLLQWFHLSKYILFAAAMLGVRSAFLHLDATLPKWIMRQFGEVVWFPLFQAINPLAILVLVPLVAVLPVPKKWRDRPIAWICVGTAIIAASLIPLATVPWEWMVVPALVVFTIGEAVGMSVVSNYVLAILPVGEYGLYQSVMAIPQSITSVLILASSGWLLDAYCPSSVVCDPRLWWWVAGAAVATPLVTGWLWAQQMRVQKQWDTYRGPHAHAMMDEEQSS